MLFRSRAEAGELRDAVDEMGDLRAEPLLDVREPVLRVLGDVVEERRDDRDRVEADLGEDLRRGDRVDDVWLARGPLLVRVRLHGERECPLDVAEVGARVGTVLMATLFGMALGGWMSGAIFDLTGSYRAAFVNGIAWNLLNLSIVLVLLYRARRYAAT